MQDRGLQYGDGCFETIRIHAGMPILLRLHLERLERSCRRLGIPLELPELNNELKQILDSNDPDGVVKITVTRGSGGRGYRPNNQSQPTRIIQYFPYPADYNQYTEQGVSVMVCQHRLSSNAALSGMKHLNRLDQVLASMELSDEFAEGICLDQIGNVIEGTKSNLLLVKNDRLMCPDLSVSGVRGIMQQFLLHRFAKDGMQSENRVVALEELKEANELFLCNSVFGVWPVIKLVENDTVFEWSVGPRTRQAILYHNEVFNFAS